MEVCRKCLGITERDRNTLGSFEYLWACRKVICKETHKIERINEGIPKECLYPEKHLEECFLNKFPVIF
jgi:hypothetical protein